jgi:hypothetical protein
MEKVIGMREEDAIVYLASQKMVLRVIRQDGVDYMVTDDYRIDRVNVEINKGVITAFTGIG